MLNKSIWMARICFKQLSIFFYMDTITITPTHTHSDNTNQARMQLGNCYKPIKITQLFISYLQFYSFIYLFIVPLLPFFGFDHSLPELDCLFVYLNFSGLFFYFFTLVLSSSFRFFSIGINTIDRFFFKFSLALNVA